MSNFRGRAPSGLINRETGNYAYLGENGELIVDGSHCLSDNGENLLAVDPTDKGLTLNRSSMADFVKSVVPEAEVNIDLATDSDVDGLFIWFTGDIMSVEAKKLIDLTRLSRFKELMDQSVDGKLSRLKLDLVQVVSVLPEISAAEEGVLYLVPAKASGEYDLYAKETVDGTAKFVKNSSLSISGDLGDFLLKADADAKFISTASVAGDTITLSRPDGSTVVITVNNVEHATKADQDGNGAVIADTYETKADAQAHVQTAEATYQKAADITLATTEDVNALFA